MAHAEGPYFFSFIFSQKNKNFLLEAYKLHPFTSSPLLPYCHKKVNESQWTHKLFSDPLSKCALAWTYDVHDSFLIY